MDPISAKSEQVPSVVGLLPIEKSICKTQEVASDVFTPIAKLCVGATTAFLFATIFFSHIFIWPTIISFIAACIAGLVSEGTGLFSATGSEEEGDKTSSCSQTPFIEGQQVHIPNKGLTCFIDSVFHVLEAVPPYKEALIGSCEKLSEQFKAFEELILWLKGCRGGLSHAEIASLIPLLANPLFFGEEMVKKKFESEDIPESVKFFGECIERFRQACRKGAPDPKWENFRDIRKIAEVFEADQEWFKQNQHWTKEDLETGVKLKRWASQFKKEVKEWNKDPNKEFNQPILKFSENDLGCLAFIFSRVEYREKYKEMIGDLIQEEKAPEVLKKFNATVIEFSKKVEDEPQEQPPTFHFFDFMTAIDFEMIAQEHSARIKAIESVSPLFKQYEDDLKAESHKSEVDLNPWRGFLLEGRQEGQQDAMELLCAMFTYVDARDYPDIFFELGIEKRLENVNRNNSIKQRLKPHKSLEISIPIPNTKADGQTLINGYFAFKNSNDSQVKIDKEDYNVKESRYYLQTNPEYFIVSLGRFNNNREKNNSPVYLPEFPKIGGATYKIVTMIRHDSNKLNGGHYYTLVNNEKTKRWEVYDDLYGVYEADTEKLKKELSYGYGYILKRCDENEAVVPRLKNWPPKLKEPIDEREEVHSDRLALKPE